MGVRVFKPNPRTQVVAPGDGVEIWASGDTRVWRVRGYEARENADCQATNTVGVFGSSILFGSGVEGDETWSALLSIDDTCVRNFSGPGYGYEAKLARLREEVDNTDVVLWEHWDNDSGRFHWVGERGYNLSVGVPVDASGVPDAFGLPAALNGLLLRRSRVYEYAALARLADMGGSGSVIDPLDAVLEAVGDRPLVVVVPPPLHESFVRTLRAPKAFMLGVDAWAEDHGVTVVHLAEEFVDDDYRELRLDACCHYNPRGHERLAEVLHPLLSKR
jgi:hypothetical protein